jgi:hypothetical protein
VSDDGLTVAERLNGPPGALSKVKAPLPVGHVRPALAHVLDAVCEFLSRFIVFPSKAAVHAVALFIAATWVADAFDVAPYVIVTGPEKRTGKSRLLEVIALLVRSPVLAASITEAALFRVIDSQSPPPTVLIDEADAIFAKRAESVEGLRAVINAGHRRGAKVYRMAGARGDKLQEFSAFGPKVLSGIGDFAPDTVADRSIAIHLQRKGPCADMGGLGLLVSGGRRRVVARCGGVSTWWIWPRLKDCCRSVGRVRPLMG